jgi:HK97 gp10 family phage protein
MAGIIKLKGFKEFRNKLKTVSKQIKQELGGETFAAAKNWERLAKQAAPVDQGRLRSAIHGSQINELSSKVVCNVDYAAYVEWGTKKNVRVPTELSSYAATFRGGGPGGPGARIMIYAWMERVGVPKELQWITFISIIVNGIKPQPFFFPPSPIVEKEFIKNVNQVLKTPH